MSDQPDEDHHFAATDTLAAEHPTPLPVAAPPSPTGPFDHLDTGYLVQARKDLMHPIPGDPSFMAHLGNLMRTIIQHALNDPARKARDEQIVADAQAALDAPPPEPVGTVHPPSNGDETKAA